MRYITTIDGVLDCYYVDNLVSAEGAQLSTVVPLKHRLPATEMARLLRRAAQWFEDIAADRITPEPPGMTKEKPRS